jgi:hypothetical protein
MPAKRALKVKPTAEPTPTPQVGDRVTIGNSDTVFIITRASPNGKDVDLNLPGTNMERFRVPTEDLKFVDLAPRPPTKPAKPAINVEEVRERIATAQHASMDQLSGDIAILKKYLKSKGVPAEAAEGLDRLCKATEERWESVVKAINEVLE